MAKSISAIKDILKREEKVLEKLLAALPLIAHKESKATLTATIKNKKADIKAYLGILKNSEKCPAVVKTATAKAKAKGAVAIAALKAKCSTKKC